jgi:hypothetical protein
MANFRAWVNSPLRALARDEQVAGRLQASAPLTIADLANAADTRTGAGAFELLGPGDVARLVPATISRRFPAPGAIDAEETKAALVEFSRPELLDLPWRYSPEVDHTVGAERRLRPWIVLIVGTDDELTFTPDGYVVLAPVVQAAHRLAGSWRWAHVHEIDGTTVARLLCPRDFSHDTRYTACVVPAFVVEADGTLHDAWPVPGAGPVRVACFDRWSFRTGPDGDFPQLAELLRAVTAQSLGEDFGTASIHYDRRGTGTPRQALLGTAGALQRPTPVPTTAPDAWVGTEVAALINPIVTPDGRWVLTAPRYHEPFGAPGATVTAGGWSENLANDPRNRGMAGLGAWAAIAWQDKIADAAWKKAGDLAIARDRIYALGLGLEASRSLWRRHMPTDPVEQLTVLASVLGRLPASGKGTVLDAIAGRTPLFARALWSSAAQRALRPGPARSHWAKPGASSFAEVLRYTARCPQQRPDPETIRVRRVDPNTQRTSIKDAILAAGARDPAFAQQVIDRLLGAGGIPSPALLAAVLAELDPGGRARPNRDAVLSLLDGRNPPPLDPADLDTALQAIGGLPHRETPCNPVDVDALGRRVAAAVDPTVARPLVVDRVLRTLPGLKDIGPIEIEPELDLPLWSFLKDASPDWLLPGIGELPDNRVVALSTNPTFVEAMLVGANHQTLGELRWRNLPIASRWSPLRKFWHRQAGQYDITPIRGWPAASALGGGGLQPADIGIEAVVVFRTTLFKRYPGTVVYLYAAEPNWKSPPDKTPLVEAQKIWPTFTGVIGDDVTFFGFPVAPAAMADHWVVLEEPVTGYRFYTEKKDGTLFGQVGNNAAEYAETTFVVPVRVMIGALLETV